MGGEFGLDLIGRSAYGSSKQGSDMVTFVFRIIPLKSEEIGVRESCLKLVLFVQKDIVALDFEKRGQVPEIFELGLVGILGRVNEVEKSKNGSSF